MKHPMASSRARRTPSATGAVGRHGGLTRDAAPKPARTAVAIVLLAGVLAGCTLPGPAKQATVNHVLTVPALPVSAGTRGGGVLLLADTRAGDFLAGNRIAFSRAEGTLGRYQYARWHEPPARAFQDALRRQLNAGGPFDAVVGFDAGVLGEHVLNTRLIAFHHDAAQIPGHARVELEAELVERANARLLARAGFVAEAPAPSHDAAGAAAALGEASARVIADVQVWLAQVRAAHAR